MTGQSQIAAHGLDDGSLQNGRTTILSEHTENYAQMSAGGAKDALLLDRPDLATLLQGIDTSGMGTGQDVVNAVNALIRDSGSSADPVVVADGVEHGRLYLDELGDLAFEASSSIRITISIFGHTVLDNIYQPGFDGMVHLDLRDLVRSHSGIYLPSAFPEYTVEGFYQEEDASFRMSVTVEVSGTARHYALDVHAFESGAGERMTDIDEMSVPSDYLLPLSVYLDTEAQSEPITAYMETGDGETELNTVYLFAYFAPGDAYLFAQDVPVNEVPYRMGKPFRIRIESNRGSVLTSVFTVANGHFEQYLFLNKYGHYDNVAMPGALVFSPEYEMENAHRTYTVEMVKASKNNLWTQTTGPLSRKTLEALSELLLSPIVYHYVPGKSLRRIVIENPALNVSSRLSVNSASFSWRYVDKTL